MDDHVYECPHCGRIASELTDCVGGVDDTHAPTLMQEADELREALVIDERLPH